MNVNTDKVINSKKENKKYKLNEFKITISQSLITLN